MTVKVTSYGVMILKGKGMMASPHTLELSETYTTCMQHPKEAWKNVKN